MDYRFLGASGLQVSTFSFGTMTLGGEGRFAAMGNVQVEEARQLVEICIDAGVNLFDTADIYSNGRSEEVLGRALGTHRKEIVLATKVCNRFEPGTNKAGLSRRRIIEGCEDSLRRLETDYIDIYQSHSFDSYTPLEETLGALGKAVKAGKVRAIGFSEWTAEQIETAAAITDAGGLTAFSSSQPQYSMLWRKPEGGVFAACARHGIGNLAFSPLAHGVLTGKYAPGQPPPPGSRAASEEMNAFMETAGRHYRSDYLLQAVAGLKPIAAELGLTMAQMALKWVLRRPEVASAIIGASRPEQVADNVRAVGAQLPAEALERIDRAVGGVAVWA